MKTRVLKPKQENKFKNSNFRLLSQRAKLKTLVFTAEPGRKTKTNNQQLLRNKLKLELKYEVNIRFETQIWKPGPDLKMKNLEMRSWIPGLNLEKNRLKPGNGHFLFYFNKFFIWPLRTNLFWLQLGISLNVNSLLPIWCNLRLTNVYGITYNCQRQNKINNNIAESTVCLVLL